MPNDAIQAARVAAATACERAKAGEGLRDWQAIADATVIAFLRALPDMGAWDRAKGRPDTVTKFMLRKLAAAVEQARDG